MHKWRNDKQGWCILIGLVYDQDLFILWDVGIWNDIIDQNGKYKWKETKRHD